MTRDRLLLLVTGAGRSGTSTMAGALARLGFEVPQPVIQASEANPRGFYESWWPVRFHNKLLERAALAKSDGQPDAPEMAESAVRPVDRERLRAWLAEQLDAADRVVVKDPRAAVLPGLWSDAANAVGVDIGYVTMLRDPTEVIGSRAAYYEAGATPSLEQASRIATAWLSHHLALERRTRDQRRAFVQFTDLLEDWRASISDMTEALGLGAEVAVEDEAAAEVDEFVEPELRRQRPGWDTIPVPDGLRMLVEDAWAELVRLSGPVSHDRAAEDALDGIASRYRQLYAEAAAITSHLRAMHVEEALRRGRAEGRQEEATPPADAPASSETGSVVGRLARRIRRGGSR